VGAATGGYTYSGSATSGAYLPNGTATGAYAYAGSASGSKPAGGTATGTYELLGLSVTGTRPSTGATTGTYVFTATVAGESASGGLAVGSFTFTGSAVGAAVDATPPRDLSITIDLNTNWTATLNPAPWSASLDDDAWSATLTPTWSASLDRFVWRAHINPPEDPVYATDRAIYTPTVTITAATNQDLTGTTFRMRIDQGAWVPPDDTDIDGNVARLKLLVGTEAYPVTAGKARVYVSINDTPEDFDIYAGSLRVEPAPA
jgi:hypothetical protein